MAKILLLERIEVPSRKRILEESGGADNTPGYLTESKNGKLIVTFPATTLGKKNENGRIYSKAVMEGAINNCSADMKARKLLCAVNDHPEDIYVPPGQASHLVTNAWTKDDGYMYTECEILGTHNGQDFKALVEADVSIGFSIRGLGSVDAKGNIQEDYEFLGVDCVGNPSAKIWSKATPTLNSNPAREAHVESSVNQINLSESTSRPSGGSKSMKTLAEVTRFIEENKVLLKHDKTPIDKFQRVMAVEAALSTVEIPPVELGRVAADWDEFKNKELTPADTSVQYKAQTEAFMKVVRKNVSEMISKHKTEVAKLARQVKTLSGIVTHKESIIQETKLIARESQVKAAAATKVALTKHIQLETMWSDLTHRLLVSESGMQMEKFYCVDANKKVKTGPYNTQAECEEACESGMTCMSGSECMKCGGSYRPESTKVKYLGLFEYKGRRGYRIKLGEEENVILTVPSDKEKDAVDAMTKAQVDVNTDVAVMTIPSDQVHKAVDALDKAGITPAGDIPSDVAPEGDMPPNDEPPMDNNAPSSPKEPTPPTSSTPPKTPVESALRRRTRQMTESAKNKTAPIQDDSNADRGIRVVTEGNVTRVSGIGRTLISNADTYESREVMVPGYL